MEWKYQKFFRYRMQVSRMKSTFRKDLGKEHLRALCCPPASLSCWRGFDLKGLFCSGLAFFPPKGLLCLFIYLEGRQRSREGACSVTAYK